MGKKLDDNGDPVPVKGKPRKMVSSSERRLVDACQAIQTEEEIREIDDIFAVNPDAFDLDEFFLRIVISLVELQKNRYYSGIGLRSYKSSFIFFLEEGY